MKCAVCNYKYEKYDFIGETIGDEDFVKLFISGESLETNRYESTNVGYLERKHADLYGCPKCGSVRFEFK